VTTPANTALKISTVRISDVNASSNPMLVSLAVGHGALSLGSITGVVMVDGNGSDGMLSFTGAQSAIDAAFASGLSFTPASGYAGTDTLTVTADDQGYTGDGAAHSATQVIEITVVRVPTP